MSVSEDIFGCHNWGWGKCAIGVTRVEARVAAKYLKVHTQGSPPRQGIIRPKMWVVLRLKDPVVGDRKECKKWFKLRGSGR